MFKIAILGCENSHADSFLDVIRDENLRNIQVAGVYSSFPGAAERLREIYGVPVMERFDELVGQIDGLIITARHGDAHYSFAKPYISTGIPMFIDKPITICEEDAKEFFRDLKANHVPASGGSILKHATGVKELKEMVGSQENGSVVGGYLRSPMDIHSEHGGFYFYAQHLVQSMCEIFGYYPKSVFACRTNDQITCTVRYDDYDVVGLFVNKDYLYYASVQFHKGFVGSAQSRLLSLEGTSSQEFHEYYNLLLGKPQSQSYEELFAPVFIMNAIERSLESGHEEPVHRM